jgi:GNAT superfamily N-acetyltransferase
MDVETVWQRCGEYQIATRPPGIRPSPTGPRLRGRPRGSLHVYRGWGEMGVTVLLRTGNGVDCPAVGALHHRSRAAAYAHFLSPQALNFGSPEALGEWWSERWKWEHETHRLTVAVDGDRIVGFSYLGPDEEPGVMLLNAIHVDPSYLGGGVGKLLMLDALPHLGDRAVLWVLERNDRARRFYEKGGWVFDGTTRDESMGGENTHQLRYTWPAMTGDDGRVNQADGSA